MPRGESSYSSHSATGIRRDAGTVRPTRLWRFALRSSLVHHEPKHRALLSTLLRYPSRQQPGRISTRMSILLSLL